MFLKIKKFAKTVGLTEYYYFFLKIWYSSQIFLKELIFDLLVSDSLFDENFNNNEFLSLTQKLNDNGIKWPLKQNNDNHIAYAGINSNWEIINIPQELSKLGSVSTFFLNNEIKSKSIYAKRKYVDTDFYNWIVKTHNKKKINALITYYSGAEILPKTILKIKNFGIPVFTFHLDDRLHFFGKLSWFRWTGPYGVCKYYDANLSSCYNSLKQYKFFNSTVIYSPEGANPNYFKPNNNVKKIYDVVFIGAKYGRREKFIKKLSNMGIKVVCFGYGWKNGSISNDDYIKVINQSKIILGFGYISFTNYQTLKGRDFEIPSCGAVYLTTHNQELSTHFEIGKEILTFKDINDCYNKIKIILSSSKLKSNIENKSREKIINEHTWEKRFKYLLFGN